MKKAICCVLLSVLLCAPSYGEVAINESAFPDNSFREYVKSFDSDNNNILSDEELNAVTSISAGGYSAIEYERDMTTGIFIPVYKSRYNINSLKGIEYFTSLQVLDCSFNALEDLDVSNFPSLTYLNCAGNQIQTLDISRNSRLKTLWCCRNKLSSLYVSHNPELEELYCWDNNISELDVSNNEELSVLFCSNNNLSELDVSRNVKLWSLSCGKNSIRVLDISNNHALIELYTFRNKLTAINTENNSLLARLSLTKNDLGSVNIKSNSALKALDCGSNYLVGIDLAGNSELEELYCYDTPIRNIDLASNTFLVSLDVSRNNLMTLDLSNNTRLKELESSGNCRLEALHLTETDEYYQTDIREYVGENIDRVGAVQGYQYKYSEGERAESIDTEYSEGIARFKKQTHYIYYDDPYYDSNVGVDMLSNDNMPHYIEYEYNTGAANSTASIMKVKMSLPRNSFIYLPEPQPDSGATGTPETVSKVVSIDEIADFYPFMISANSSLPITRREETTESGNMTNSGGSGGGGGGCNSGYGIFTLTTIVFAGLFVMRFRAFAAAIFIITALIVPYNSALADYVLPIEYTNYTISGTWTTDFELAQELTDKIAAEWDNAAVAGNKLSASALTGNIHLYSDSALPGTWTVRPVDLYSLAMNGEYGGVVLPVTDEAQSGDVYVALCTFSGDVEPGERIAVHGFQIDADERESLSDEDKFYVAKFVVLDENYRRVDSVPDNKRVYIAVSLSPEYINSGIVTVVRGQYITEDEPLYRLTPDAAQNIANQLGISPSDLKYLTRANIGKPISPTEAMKTYVKNDNHEIIANLPTISVDEPGRYLIPITLSSEDWEALKDKTISDYKFYALNDSELGDEQMKPAFINGLIATWELFTLGGEKMNKFGVREFLMVGLLDSGQPFSLFIARLLLTILTGGGCNTGVVALAALILLLALKR